MSMKIAFECSPLVKQKTGVGWYCYNLLEQFLKFAEEEFVLFSFSLKLRKPDLPEGWLTRSMTRYRFYAPLPRLSVMFMSKFVGEKTSRLLLPAADVAHFPNFTCFPIKGAKIVLTVHDLGFVHYPETIERRNLFLLRSFFKESLDIAAVVITHSISTKKDLVSLFNYPQEKIVVVPLGVDHSIYRPMFNMCVLEAFKQRHSLGQYILFLGTLEPRKNPAGLLKAYVVLCKEMGLDCAPDLVFGGSKGWGSDSFNMLYSQLNEDIKKKIHFLGYLPKEELPLLYSGARAFTFPSLWEGFGLPPLEAMACGVPVVTSNVSSLPEVVENAALLVDPNSHEQIAEAIYKVLTDEDLASKLKYAGIKQAAKFTWKNTAQQTLEVYKNIAKG